MNKKNASKKCAAQDKKLIDKIPDVLAGLRVEAWLRIAILKSLSSPRFLPNARGDISVALNALKGDDRRQFIVILTNAHERASAQTDFMGIIGIPIAIALITVVSAFDIPLEAIGIFFLILLGYLLIYYYYRLMKALLTSILSCREIK